MGLNNFGESRKLGLSDGTPVTVLMTAVGTSAHAEWSDEVHELISGPVGAGWHRWAMCTVQIRHVRRVSLVSVVIEMTSPSWRRSSPSPSTRLPQARSAGPRIASCVRSKRRSMRRDRPATRVCRVQRPSALSRAAQGHSPTRIHRQGSPPCRSALWS